MDSQRRPALLRGRAATGACSSRKDQRSPGPMKAQVEYEAKQVKAAEELQKKVNETRSAEGGGRQ